MFAILLSSGELAVLLVMFAFPLLNMRYINYNEFVALTVALTCLLTSKYELYTATGSRLYTV